MAGRSRILIGCSGWMYRSWKGPFYPKDLATSAWLPFYAKHFATVELNNSFYRLPERKTFEAWAEMTPRRFVFAVKASRYLTHLKRLTDPAEPLKRLLERASGLGPHLGPILYQLPASLRYDADRLDVFLAALGRLGRRLGTRQTGTRTVPLRHVIEFRDPSWYRPDVMDVLERAGVAICLHDKLQGPFLGEPAGEFAYIRFHGTSGHYAGSYSDAELRGWATRMTEWSRQGRDVYAYFNNDPAAAAPKNAETLTRGVRS